jgi:hypothetical protein
MRSRRTSYTPEAATSPTRDFHHCPCGTDTLFGNQDSLCVGRPMLCHPERSKTPTKWVSCVVEGSLSAQRLPPSHACGDSHSRLSGRAQLDSVLRSANHALPSRWVVAKFDCHSVSNDAAPCQAFLGDTPASTPKAAPFRSSRTPLMSRPSSSLSSISQRDLRPHHPSLRDLLPRLLTSISPTLQGGRLPTQTLGFVTRRPRNDSGSPA